MTASPEAVADTRRRILDAAAEAFMRSGFAATTIDDLARDVGATKGLVYYHFRSKFDVFLAVYEEGMRRVRDRVEPLADGPGSAHDRLVAMCVGHVLNLMEDLSYHHVIHQAARGEASSGLKVRQREALLALNQLRGDYELLFQRVVREGVADGSLRDLDPPLAARVLLSNLNAVDHWYHRIDGQGADQLQDLAQRVVDLLINGMV